MIDERRRAYQDAAEVRLGRELTAAERHIDIQALDVALRTGKFRLAAAIDMEKGRAIRASLDGKAAWRPQLTADMMNVLTDLHELGIETGLRELRSMGYLADRSFASPDTDELEAARKKVIQALKDGAPKRRIGALRKAFEALLQSLGLRIRRTTRKLKPVLTVKLDTLARRKIEREAERRVPGSMDIAGRLVSGALYAGLGATFEEHQDLIPCWEYSAIMDNATCAPCRESDGRRFDTWKAAMKVLPGGGPNPLCRGDGRCRCRLVPCLPGTDVETGEPSEKVEQRLTELLREPTEQELHDAYTDGVGGYEPADLSDFLKDEITTAVKRVDKEVRIRVPGTLEPVPVFQILRSGGTTGLFGRKLDGTPSRFGLAATTPPDLENLPAGSITHEMGHYLDAVLRNRDGTFTLGTGSRRRNDSGYGSNNRRRRKSGPDEYRDPAYAKLFEAIESTASITKLRDMAANPNFFEGLLDVYGRPVNVSLPFVEYMSRPHEIFARAFRAYIAAKGGYPEELAFLDRTSAAAYLYPDGFNGYDRKILVQAFDEFFQSVGFTP